MVEQRQAVRVNAAEVAAKFRSKPECYRFLTVNAKATCQAAKQSPFTSFETSFQAKPSVSYLRSKSNHFFVFVLVVKCDDIRYIYCPQYEGLTVDTMKHESLKYQQVALYLPCDKELPKVPR